MKKIASLIFGVLLFAGSAAQAATGDVKSVIIDRTGSFLFIKLEGLSSGGTFSLGSNPSNYKIVLTVTTQGYDATATLGAKTRTVYGTCRMQVPFNSDHIKCGTITGGPLRNQETITQATSGATAKVIRDCPCSPVFVRPNVTGTPDATHIWTGGTSGATFTPTEVPTSYGEVQTDFSGVDGSDLWVAVSLHEDIKVGDTATATIAGGFYSGSNAISGATVTNQSQLSHATPILRWNQVPGLLVGNSLRLEAQAYHQRGAGQAPVACVIFTVADQHSHAISHTVTTVTPSQVVAGKGIENYGYTFTASDLSPLTDGDTLTDNVSAYPLIGTSSQIKTSVGGTLPDICPLTMLLDKTQARATVWYVSPTGNDSTGTGSSGSPYATIGKAAAAASAIATDGKADGAIIILKSGNHLFGSGTFTISAERACIVVQADPAGSFDSNGISTTSFISGPDTNGRSLGNMCRIRNLSSTANFWTFGGAHYIFDNLSNSGAVDFNPGTSIYFLKGVTAGVGGWNDQKTVLAMGTTVNGATSPSLCVTGCAITLDGSGTTNVWVPPVVALQNVILSFNKIKLSNGATFYQWSDGNPVSNFADVMNAVERIGTDTDTISTISGASNHIIIWHDTRAGQRDDWQAPWDTQADYSTGVDVALSNWSVKYNSFHQVCWNDDEYAGSTNGLSGSPHLVGGWPNKYGVNWEGNNHEEALFPPQCLGEDGTMPLPARYTDPEQQFVSTFPISGASGAFIPFERVTFTDGSSGFLLTATSPCKVLMNIGNSAVPNGTMSGASSGKTASVGSVTAAIGGGNYSPTSSSPLLNKIRAGMAVLPFDLAGNAIPNNGTGSAGAFQFASSHSTPAPSWSGHYLSGTPISASHGWLNF